MSTEKTDYTDLKGNDLVKYYNDLANSPTGKELKAKQKERFASDEEGLQFVDALASSIKASQDGAAELKARKDKEMANTKPTKAKKAKSKTKKKAGAKKVAAKSKTAKKARKGNGAAKVKAPPREGIAADFGFRETGERADVLRHLHKNLGKKFGADALAKLTDKKSTTAVAMCADRITKKAAKYKLPYKMMVEKTEDGRMYSLQKK